MSEREQKLEAALRRCFVHLQRIRPEDCEPSSLMIACRDALDFQPSNPPETPDSSPTCKCNPPQEVCEPCAYDRGRASVPPCRCAEVARMITRIIDADLVQRDDNEALARLREIAEGKK